VKIPLLLFFFYTFNSSRVLAHEENKLGPHHGFIKMPGAFHTELVPLAENSFNIYFMDVSNSNPTIKDITVQVTYQFRKKRVHFTCQSLQNHFNCKPNEKVNTKEGELVLKIVRFGNNSKDAIYDLPLKLSGIQNKKDKMKEHDMKKMK